MRNEEAVANEEEHERAEDEGVYRIRILDAPPGTPDIYVGSSDDTVKRIAAHKAGHGCLVTQGRKVERLPLLSRQLCRDKLLRETIETFENMITYGINHVRGAGYASPSIDTLDAKRQIMHQFNLCKRCGRQGHFASSCSLPWFDGWEKGFMWCRFCHATSHMAWDCVA